MKYLRLYSEDGIADDHGFTWNIPLELQHSEVGLSSIHVLLNSDIKNTPGTVPIQCSLIKENMWNTNGVFYNLDLWASTTDAYSARPGGVGMRN